MKSSYKSRDNRGVVNKMTLMDRERIDGKLTLVDRIQARETSSFLVVQLGREAEMAIREGISAF